MTVAFAQFWPEHNLTLRAYREAYREHRPEDDQPAMLDWAHDADGLIRAVPLKIEVAIEWASWLLDDDSEPVGA